MTHASPCADCRVRSHALCAALDDGALATFRRLGHRQALSRGESLAWAGGGNAACANLISGVLKLSAVTPDGAEQVVALFHPADFVGHPFAARTGFTVTALTDAELCVFPRACFESALADHAAMERLLLRRAFAALEDARHRMVMLARAPAAARVARFLLDTSDRAGSPGFDLPLTRGEMAEVLGLTIETVSRQLGRLKSAGTIALTGARGVAIRDRAALESAAG